MTPAVSSAKIARAERRSAQNATELATTTVIDAGARYGMHPSWRGFGGSLRYLAFEPDPQEAKRLREQRHPPGFEVIEQGLAKGHGTRQLRITRHRGYSSFLEIDRRCEWFARYRPGEESEVETIVRVPTCSIDHVAHTRKLRVDFLKVDTEGTELDVLEGAAKQLGSDIMGVRANVNFQPVHRHQSLFTDIQTYLTAKGFMLLNMDYVGRGIPHYGLFRNPDPLLLDQERYGVLLATDVVWLKPAAWLFERYRHEADACAYAVLKYAYFCLLNHAADVGLNVLTRFVTERHGTFRSRVESSELYRAFRRKCATFLGRWRVYPDAQWELACSTFKTVFGLELASGSGYWELIQRL